MKLASPVSSNCVDPEQTSIASTKVYSNCYTHHNKVSKICVPSFLFILEDKAALVLKEITSTAATNNHTICLLWLTEYRKMHTYIYLILL